MEKEEQEKEERPRSIQTGDKVWVKPLNVCCTSKQGEGSVTELYSKNNISVDGCLESHKFGSQ